MPTSTTLWLRISIGIVLIHAVVTMIHSAAHSALLIYMSTWQNIYIFVVIVAMPILAGVLLWRRSRMGFVILLISMLGSLLFGSYYHFILPGPDNVSHLPAHPWTAPFQISAALVAITEAAGVVVGLKGWISKRL